MTITTRLAASATKNGTAAPGTPASCSLSVVGVPLRCAAALAAIAGCATARPAAAKVESAIFIRGIRFTPIDVLECTGGERTKALPVPAVATVRYC
jgi:hypothetical protein